MTEQVQLRRGATYILREGCQCCRSVRVDAYTLTLQDFYRGAYLCRRCAWRVWWAVVRFPVQLWLHRATEQRRT